MSEYLASHVIPFKQKEKGKNTLYDIYIRASLLAACNQITEIIKVITVVLLLLILSIISSEYGIYNGLKWNYERCILNKIHKFCARIMGDIIYLFTYLFIVCH